MINTQNNELKDRLINKGNYLGLSSQEATSLLEKFGLNEIEEEKKSLWLNLYHLKK